MTGATHVLFGLLFSMAIPAPDVSTRLLMFSAATLGALLPDVDHPNGTLNNKLKVSRLLAWVLPHRGFTHSALCLALLAGLAWWASGRWGHDALFVAGIVAYGAHLLADALTVHGIPLLMPFYNERISLAPIRTGGIIERLLAVASIIILCSLVLKEVV